MSKSTISTFELFAMFPDPETARTYLEGRLWPNGPTCPVCGLGDRLTARKGGFYRCNQCREDFTVRTGTIFERSHVPLHKWVYAMYLLVTARKGNSSLQLSKEIGITQKSAWFVLHRLREACGNDLTMLQGIVEIDETYVGGIEGNKHKSKKLNVGGGTGGKTAVLGMKERGKGGRTKGIKIEATDAQTIQDVIVQNVEVGSTLHTDEHLSYAGIGGLFFDHDTINHSEGEYVRDGVTTNSIESVFAVLKRGLMSDIDKICDECGAPFRDHMIGGIGPYHPRPTKPVIPSKYPVAWRVEDLRIGYVEFKDIGWVLFNDEEAAEEFSEQTGGEMQGLYAKDAV